MAGHCHSPAQRSQEAGHPPPSVHSAEVRQPFLKEKGVFGKNQGAAKPGTGRQPDQEKENLLNR